MKDDPWTAPILHSLKKGVYWHGKRWQTIVDDIKLALPAWISPDRARRKFKNLQDVDVDGILQALVTGPKESAIRLLVDDAARNGLDLDLINPAAKKGIGRFELGDVVNVVVNVEENLNNVVVNVEENLNNIAGNAVPTTNAANAHDTDTNEGFSIYPGIRFMGSGSDWYIESDEFDKTAEEGLTGNDKTAGEGLTGNDKTAEEGLTGNDKTSEEGLTGNDKTAEEGLTGNDKTAEEGLTGNDKTAEGLEENVANLISNEDFLDKISEVLLQKMVMAKKSSAVDKFLDRLADLMVQKVEARNKAETVGASSLGNGPDIPSANLNGLVHSGPANETGQLPNLAGGDETAQNLVAGQPPILAGDDETSNPTKFSRHRPAAERK